VKTFQTVISADMTQFSFRARLIHFQFHRHRPTMENIK